MLRRKNHRRISLIESLETRKLLAAILSDQTVNGQIASPAEVDEFTISLNAGNSIVATAAETASSNFGVRLRLQAPDGTLLDENFGNSGAWVSASNVAQSGVYKVLVSDNTSTYTGNYALTVGRSPGSQASNDTDGGMVSTGDSKQGTIALGDLDVYQMQITQGDHVVMSLADTNSGFYPEIIAYGPDGSAIETNWDNNGYQIKFTAATTGTYSFMILDHYGYYAGDYTFSAFRSTGTIVDDANDTDFAAARNGERQIGVIALGDMDVVTSQITQGETVIVSIADVSNTFYPELSVYGPDGSLVDSSWHNSGLDLTFQAATSGNYRILVHDHYGYYEGNYALSVFKSTGTIQDDVSDDDSAVIQLDQRKLGEITLGDSDAFKFSASQGDSILLTYADINNGFYPKVAAFAPDGSAVASDWNNNGGVLSFTAASTGMYTFVIYDHYGYYAGDYSVTAFKSTGMPATDPIDIDTGTLSNGSTRNGSIALGDIDTYKINATTGQDVTIRLNDISGNGYPELAVYGPDGAFIDSDWSTTAATVTFTPAVTGQYTLAVFDHYGYYTCTYGLAVNTNAVTTDTTNPGVLGAFFNFNRSDHALNIYFSERVTGLTVADLAVLNVTTGVQVSSVNIEMNEGGHYATLTYPGLLNQRLTEGNYRLTVNSGAVQDLSGNNSGAGLTYNFHVLTGDVNRDRKVDFSDLLVMAQNYGTLGRLFSYGNFNYSQFGNVDFEDLLLLAQKYGTQLPQPKLGVGDSVFGSTRRIELIDDESSDELTSIT